MRDIYSRIAEDPQMRKLAHYLDLAGMTDALRGPGPFTLFAPHDGAFGRTNIEEAHSFRSSLGSTLAYHLATGRHWLRDIRDMLAIRTENGKSLTITLEEGAVLADNARLVCADIECSNGLIHVIDNVFQPLLSGWYGEEFGG